MTRTQLIDQIVISSGHKITNSGIVCINQINFSCLIGFGGIGHKTREGDGITPLGCWKMSYLLYRPDRIRKPISALSGFAIKQNDNWCDLVTSNHYNLPLAITLAKSSEALWREDNLYDIVIVLDHNSQPAIKGKGSAIFIHLSGTDKKYTQGCLAFDKSDLLKILNRCGPETKVLIR